MIKLKVIIIVDWLLFSHFFRFILIAVTVYICRLEYNSRGFWFFLILFLYLVVSALYLYLHLHGYVIILLCFISFYLFIFCLNRVARLGTNWTEIVCLAFTNSTKKRCFWLIVTQQKKKTIFKGQSWNVDFMCLAQTPTRRVGLWCWEKHFNNIDDASSKDCRSCWRLFFF